MKHGYIVIVLGFLAACGGGQETEKVLPVIGNCDVVYNKEGENDTICPTIPHFEYLNQDSVTITSGEMKGKIWVAQFFFATCPTICPPMTTQMKRLNEMTKDLKDEIQFISFTINPEHDKPAVLRNYIKKHGITASNWQFLTGNEAETHELGINYFMVHANADENAAGGYAHSDAFTLVDKEGYVRGVYVGTSTEQVDLMEKDIRKLLKHEYGIE